MSHNDRVSYLSLFVPTTAAIVALMPVVGFGQAAAIVRSSLPLPDAEWIARHCAEIAVVDIADDAEREAWRRLSDTCEAYEASDKTAEDRDDWIAAMLSFQDDFGERTMRRFPLPVIHGALPRDLASYALFLFPDDEWLDGRFASESEVLLQQFRSFGRRIGDRHAAIWLEDDRGDIDTLRSRVYCDLFGLDYEEGPFVVFTKTRPDIFEPGDDRFVLRLGGLDAQGRKEVLDLLERNIRVTGDVDASALVYEEIWQRMSSLFGGLVRRN